MHYRTATTPGGRTYPHSAQIAGWAARALGLSTADLAEMAGVTDRTIRSMFDGSHIEAADSAFDAMWCALLRDDALHQTLRGANGRTAAERLGRVIRGALRRWDETASRANTENHPLPNDGRAMVPALRFVALDLGMRWGAYQALKSAMSGDPPCDAPAWLRPNAFAAFVRERQDANTVSNKELARRCGVDPGTVRGWRNKSVPDTERILPLARALGAGELETRLHRAGQILHEEMVATIEQGALDSLRAAFSSSSSIVSTVLVALLRRTKDAAHGAVQGIVDLGARAPLARELVPVLGAHALRAKLPAVAMDLRSISGDWVDALNEWSRQLSQHAFAEEVARRQRLSVDEARARLRAQEQWLLSVWRFDVREPVGIAQPSNFLVLSRDEILLAQARLLAEGGDLVGAANIARSIARSSPDDPAAWNLLACFLGQLVRFDMSLADDGVLAANVAMNLDPLWPQPANELGIVLANAERREEAEGAYERAAALCAGWVHHHHARGTNLVMLRRFKDAIAQFDAVLAIDKNHVDAIEGLAIACSCLGQTRRARDLVGRAEHLGVEGTGARVEAAVQALKRHPTQP